MINIDSLKIEEVELTDLAVHALAETTPGYTREALEALRLDIQVQGQTDPVLVYRNKIVDGRHRYICLTELGESTVKVQRLPNNTTVKELSALVTSKEMRRHASTAQRAIYAVKQRHAILEAGGKLVQADAATMYGVVVKEMSRAGKIGGSKKGQFNRPDLIETLFRGDKINIGDEHAPFFSDSLQGVINWLGKTEAGLVKDVTGISPIEKELSHDEEVLVNQILNRVKEESCRVKEAIASRLYTELKE